MNSPLENPEEKALSDEDLRALARRHARIYRQFRARVERERRSAEQQAMIFSMARQMAAMMVSSAVAQTPQNSAQTPNSEKSENGKSENGKSGTEKSAGTPKKSGKKDEKSGENSGVQSVPATDASGENGELYPEPGAVRGGKHFAEPEISPLQRWARLIGADSLMCSLVLHVALFILALFWVVSVHVAEPEEEPQSFVSGSGGGRGGESPSYADVQKSRRNKARFGNGPAAHKIVTKAAQAEFALPEVPSLALVTGTGEFSSDRFSRSLLGGNVSSGHGGGLGGGIGRGTGVGIGGGSNYVGKFQTKLKQQKILGTSVTASRLAVYVDSSASMTEVLSVVRNDVWKKFPTADIYEIFGCMMNARLSGTLDVRNAAWERERAKLLASFDREKNSSKMREKRRKVQQTSSAMAKNKRARGGYGFDNQNNWFSLLSSFGRMLYQRYAGSSTATAGPSNFDLSAWLDMVFTEGGYDAIIVVADFQDYRDQGRYDESVLLDKWVKAARANGQRCYFFTTEMLPQKIFRDLAVLTGGDIALPKETSKNSESAKETAAWIKKNKPTKTVSASEIAAQKRAVPAANTGTQSNFAETGTPVVAQNANGANGGANGGNSAGTTDDDALDDDFWNDDEEDENDDENSAYANDPFAVPAATETAPAAVPANSDSAVPANSDSAVPANSGASSGSDEDDLESFFRDDD